MSAIEVDIGRRLQKLLASKRAVPKTAALYQDLQISGDDACELLNGIAEAYGVSFQGLRFAEYFPDETSAMFHYLASRFGFRDRRRKTLTVTHLIAVVERGAWFEPPSAPKKAR